jgi:hypothetical protein
MIILYLIQFLAGIVFVYLAITETDWRSTPAIIFLVVSSFLIGDSRGHKRQKKVADEYSKDLTRANKIIEHLELKIRSLQWDADKCDNRIRHEHED